MSTIEKVLYFLVMLTLYVFIIYTARSVPNPMLEYMAIGISIIETTHWYYGLKHKRIGMFFWGTLTIASTILMVIKVSFGVYM